MINDKIVNPKSLEEYGKAIFNLLDEDNDGFISQTGEHFN